MSLDPVLESLLQESRSYWWGKRMQGQTKYINLVQDKEQNQEHEEERQEKETGQGRPVGTRPSSNKLHHFAPGLSKTWQSRELCEPAKS